MNFRVPMLLPGVNVHTTPESYYPLTTLQLQRFDGKTFVLFGDPVTIQPARPS